MKRSITFETVAAWMVKEFEKQGGVLDQDDAATKIEELFGERFVYDFESLTGGIDKRVLAAFTRLSGDSVVWSRRDRQWRRRKSADKPGRLQD
jgi:hypothetical protein